MATLSREQIASYAKQAGFKDGTELNTAVAIALAESGGNTNAYNHNETTKDDSYGLWQINMWKDLGPARRKDFGITANTALYIPTTNAKAAHLIYSRSGFNAWTTYTSGKYKQFIGSGSVTPATIDPASGTTETVAIPDIPGAITGAVNSFGSTVFKASSNIAGIVVAIALLVLGVVLLARNQVANLIPAGKVAKLAKGALK